VDGDRMAIHGTSYGGFMAISTLLPAPRRLRAGDGQLPGHRLALYDTIYTERYMGLLPENAAGTRPRRR
jgi:dipeptidyl-peptidase 4